MVAAKLERIGHCAERTDGQGEAGERRTIGRVVLVPCMSELRFPFVAPGPTLGPGHQMAGEAHDALAWRRIVVPLGMPLGLRGMPHGGRQRGAPWWLAAVSHQASPGRRPRRGPSPNTAATPGCRSSAERSAAAPAPVTV